VRNIFKVKLSELEKQILKENADGLAMILSDYVKWYCLVNLIISKEERK
jgi:hypothetical protein